MRRLAAAAVATFALALPASAGAQFEGPPVVPGTKSVLFVANNWDGTADIVDPQTFAKLGRLNVIPDLEERLAEKALDPRKLAYFVAVRALIGEGNDQYADDMFSSHDGRFVYISRPSMADVVAIEIATGKITWRFPMEGYRADHMAISPDGTRLLVSDSTARKVHVLDTATGAKVGEFESGDSPHESNYTKDGSKIFHASIGMVYTPADQPVADSTKGDRWFQVVDAKSYKIDKRLDIGQILAANGHEDYSSAVRPMAIAPGERIVYMQLSFLHGFVEFDLATDKPLRIANLPVSEEAQSTPRENYLLDSAHHGLAINHEGTKLCVAGTMSDYAAIVHRDDFSHKIVANGGKPYWATNSADGRYCFVSFSGNDEVSVLDYASERRGRADPGRRPPAADADGPRPRGRARRAAAVAGRHLRAGQAQAGEAADRPRARQAREARRAARHDLAGDGPAAGRLRVQRAPLALLDPHPEALRGAEAVDVPPRAPARPAPQAHRHPQPLLRGQPARAPGPPALARGDPPRAPAPDADEDRRAGPAGRPRHDAPRRARRRAAALRRRRRVDGAALPRGDRPRRLAPARAAAVEGRRGGRAALDPVHGRRGPPHPRRVALQGRQPLKADSRSPSRP